MSRYWAGLLGALILACAPAAALDASGVPAAVDLRAEATAAARAGGPLIVIYSREDCKFCKLIKRHHLVPLASDPRYGPRVVIREIGQDKDNAALRDFNGQPTTHADFAARQGIKLVPVVAFYGPGGRALMDPIVGTRLPDFYQSYLEEGIEQSARKLKTP
ncbi:MAG: hypothetical protein L6Q40_05370 [Azonexus sp.]|nr:hypothetical protein [Azonexus sp.]